MLTLYYNNTVGQWAMALGLGVLAFIVGRVFYWIFNVIFKKLTVKTRTRLDDILVDKLEEPAIVGVVLVGLWFAIFHLTLTEEISGWIDHGFRFCLTVNVAWLIARVYDALHQEYIEPLAVGTETTLDDQILPVVRSGVHLGVWTLGVIVGLNNAGYNVATLLAGMGIGGLAFALAAQDTVANVFGGITIFCIDLLWLGIWSRWGNMKGRSLRLGSVPRPFGIGMAQVLHCRIRFLLTVQ